MQLLHGSFGSPHQRFLFRLPTKLLSSTFYWAVVSTPLEALRFKTNVQNYHTCRKQLILKASEETDYHPKHVALAPAIPQRLPNCSSFRCRANELPTLLPPEAQHLQSISHFPSLTWQFKNPPEEHITTTVSGIISRADDIVLIPMQPRHHCFIPGWLHHLHRWIH